MPQRARRWYGAVAVCLVAVFGGDPAASAFSPASRTGSCANPDFEPAWMGWTGSTGVIGRAALTRQPDVTVSELIFTSLLGLPPPARFEPSLPAAPICCSVPRPPTTRPKIG
jgi:hypothetical protein